ncbi:hypothetical protein ACFLRI_00350 [Bacteroidota bacterium]
MNMLRYSAKTRKAFQIMQLLLLVSFVGNAQSFFDYGTITGPFTPITSGSGSNPTSLFPVPPAGDFIYGITTGAGGLVSAANPGITALGSETEAFGCAASGTTNSDYVKFGINHYGTANSKEAYVTFEVQLGGNTGYNYSNDGVWFFSIGDGQSASDFLAANTNAFDMAQTALTLRWIFTSGGNLQTAYYDKDVSGGSWVGLSASLKQGTKYVFELFVNGGTSITPSYIKNGTSYSVPVGKVDIWIDNILVVQTGAISAPWNSTSLKKIESYAFWGNASSSNTAYLYTDQTVYGLDITTSGGTNYYSKSTGALNTLATWGTNTDGTGTTPINFTDNFTNFYIRNNATPTITANWAVTGTGTKVILGDGTNACNFTAPASYTFSGNLYIEDNGTFTLQNTTSPVFKVLTNGSTVNYNYAGAKTIYYSPFGNLKITNTGQKTIAGQVVANGTITVGDGTNASELYIPSTFTVYGTADVLNNGTLNIANTTAPDFGTLSTGSTVKYTATGGAQSSPATDPDYYNLEIDNSNGVSLGGDATVNGTLTLTSGALSIGANNLTLEGDLSISSGSLTGGASADLTIGSTGSKISLPAISGNLHDLTVARSSGVDITSDLTATTSSISAGGILNILEGITHTVSGTMTNSNGSNTQYLNIKSSASGTGNLITGNSVYGTVQRYLEGNATNNPYHFISSPVSGGAFSDIWTSGDFNVYWYNEAIVDVDLDVGWTRILAGTLTNGLGYAVVSDYATRTMSIDGALNTGTINSPVSYTTTTGTFPNGDPQGYNLIGNPYPTAISATTFLTDNASDLAVAAVYYWDNPDGDRLRGDYASRTAAGGSAGGSAITPDASIAVGQGFFVRVNSGVSTLEFNNAQKIANSGTQFFVPELVENLNIAIEGPDHLYNEIAFSFSPDASKGYDHLYDATKLRGNPYIALYSFVEGEQDQYVIQGRPSIMETDIIPIGIHVGIDGEYSFYVKGMENFSHVTDIYLVDLQTGESQIINQDNGYHVNLTAGEYNNRFVLLIGSYAITALDEVLSTSMLFNTYMLNQDVFVNNLSENEGKVRLYNPVGQLLQEIALEAKESRLLNIPGYKGLLIVSFSSGEHQSSKKLLMN